MLPDRPRVVAQILDGAMRAWAAAVPELTDSALRRIRRDTLPLVRDMFDGLWNEFAAFPERRAAILSSCTRVVLEHLLEAWRAKTTADAAAAEVVRQLHPHGPPPLTNAAFLANLVDYAEALTEQTGGFPHPEARRRWRRLVSNRYAAVVRELLHDLEPDPMVRWIALVRLRESIGAGMAPPLSP